MLKKSIFRSLAKALEQVRAVAVESSKSQETDEKQGGDLLTHPQFESLWYNHLQFMIQSTSCDHHGSLDQVAPSVTTPWKTVLSKKLTVIMTFKHTEGSTSTQRQLLVISKFHSQISHTYLMLWSTLCYEPCSRTEASFLSLRSAFSTIKASHLRLEDRYVLQDNTHQNNGDTSAPPSSC